MRPNTEKYFLFVVQVLQEQKKVQDGVWNNLGTLHILVRSVAKIWSLRPAAFVLKLLRDWTRNRALTDNIARKIKIFFLIITYR